MPAPPYRHRAVRDLAWAVFSEPLLLSSGLCERVQPLANASFELTAARREWLHQLDVEPGALLEFLARAPRQRLGLYFERLWHFFLLQDTETDLVAHNLPVREGARTVGEFDCLYFCYRRGRYCHLELAVKYYLAHGAHAGSHSPWRIWLGPNSRDRLDLKIERLLDHQSQLATHRAGQRVLEDRGVSAPLVEVEVKGSLFRHPGNPVSPPPGFNPARTIEPWWRVGELEAVLDSGHRYLVLPRLHWLSAALAEPGTDPVSPASLLNDLQEHFTSQRQPRLVAAIDAEGQEAGRFFVTDAGWPD